MFDRTLVRPRGNCFRIYRQIRKRLRPVRRGLSPLKLALKRIAGPLVNAYIVHCVERPEEPRLFDTLKAHVVTLQVPGSYPSCNPSLVRTENGYTAVVRTINYKLYKPNVFQWLGNVIDTQNYLCDLTDDLGSEGFTWIEDTASRRALPEAVNGFEDARLIEWRGNLWLLANGCNQPEGTNTMTLSRLEGARVVETIKLSSPFGFKREKNWMPFVSEGALYVVYSLSPLRVYEVTTGGLKLVTERDLGLPASASGSTQLVPWREGWLGVIHQKHHNKKFFYRHQFVYFSKDWRLIASQPFYWREYGIEFCCGLAVNHGKVLVSGSVYDQDAFVAEFEERQIEALLKLPARRDTNSDQKLNVA